MGQLGIALIAAGSAIVGSIVTGWYSRTSGIRQAEAAREAGERQAAALLESVRVSLRAEARSRLLDVRRQTYVHFLGAADARMLAERTGRGRAEDELVLESALGAVVLEGPSEVAVAASDLVTRLRRHEPQEDLHRAKLVFVAAARQALGRPGSPAPDGAGERGA